MKSILIPALFCFDYFPFFFSRKISRIDSRNQHIIFYRLPIQRGIFGGISESTLS